MKKIFIYVGLFLSNISISAQEFHVNINGGYAFADRFDSYNNDTSFYSGKVNGSFRFSSGLEFAFSDIILSISGFSQHTDVPITYYDRLRQFRTYDLKIRGLLVGVAYRKKQGNLEGYFGSDFGSALIRLKNPLERKTKSAGRFVWGFKLGSNYFFTEHIGINYQTDFYIMQKLVGGGFYFVQDGSGAYHLGYSAISTLSIRAGIVFRFTNGNEKKISEGNSY